MNQRDQSELIDEDELRAALRPLRVDRDAFEQEVRRRVEASEAETRVRLRSADVGDDGGRDAKLERSGWLRVAASVIPLNVLGKGTSGTGTVTASFGQYSLSHLSLGQKIVALTAIPAIGILLMISATVWAYFRIRKAQLGQQSDSVSQEQLSTELIGWWKQFGLLIVGLSALSVVLMFVGFVVPVFVVLLISGITMVSLITRLGRDQMIDRVAIAGCLAPALVILAQVMQVYSMSGRGMHFLDQGLLQAVLMGGGFLLLTLSRPPARVGGLTLTLGSIVAGVLMVGWFSRSVWDPVSTRAMKAYVESFDKAPFSFASWRHWKTPAVWLQESNVQLDMTKPRALLEKEMAGDPHIRTLRFALETGLLEGKDLSQLRDLNQLRERVLTASDRGKPFGSIQGDDNYAIRAIALRGDLTDSDRDFLAERLAATFEQIITYSYGNLSELLSVTNLASSIDRPLDKEVHRETVYRMLVEFRRPQGRFGTRRGGFANSRKLDFGNSDATAAAIELMQYYGVPDEVNIAALRSYLRPTMNDHWLIDQSATRVASLQRLERLPEVQPVTLWDFLQYEQNLIMAVLFVSLCVIATQGSPRLPRPGSCLPRKRTRGETHQALRGG